MMDGIKENLSNGKRHGLSQTFYDGRLSCFTEMLDDTGENWDYYEFHRTGGLSFRMPMRNKKRNGVCKCWNEEGVLIQQDEWKDDKLDGLATKWYPNGQKKTEVTFKNHEMNGVLTEWNKQGDMISKELYTMGNKGS
jgi:antitoxin component YwqK of YwqJK toxin-antitoxin module